MTHEFGDYIYILEGLPFLILVTQRNCLLVFIHLG